MLTVDPKARITIGEALEHPWLKNAGDNIVFPQSKYSIVSLKKVDEFFNDNTIFMGLSENERKIIERQYSTKNLNMNTVVKEISENKNVFTSIKRRRLHTFSQSTPIKAVAIPIIAPQVIQGRMLMNQQMPVSHTPDKFNAPSLSRKASVNRESLPKISVRSTSAWVHK